MNLPRCVNSIRCFFDSGIFFNWATECTRDKHYIRICCWLIFQFWWCFVEG